MEQQRIIEELDRMVVAGRITPDEVTRLRAATATLEFEAVVATIRVRRTRVHTDAAVAVGTMRRRTRPLRWSESARSTTRVSSAGTSGRPAEH
jgi:hypothetical protein